MTTPEDLYYINISPQGSYLYAAPIRIAGADGALRESHARDIVIK